MAKTKKLASNYGFTLIELLLVISIIGLLASIILTATIHSKQNAQDNVLIQNVVELSKALDLYYQDNGYYPYTGMTDATPCSVSASQGLNYGSTPPAYCILGARTGFTGYYSAINNAGLAASLKPYLPTLPPQLTGVNGVPGTISLTIFDSTYVANAGAGVRDFQSNTCYEFEPNSYWIWAILNNRQTQANLNGFNSHGYIIKSANMPEIPCS